MYINQFDKGEIKMSLIPDFDQKFNEMKKECSKKKLVWAQMCLELRPVIVTSLQNAINRKQKTFRYLEIGIGHAATFNFIGRLAQRFFDNVYGVSVECDPKRERHLLALEPKFNYKFIVGSSLDQKIINEVEQTFNSEIDLLHVDGGHSKKCCTADIENYRGLIIPGGIMAVHDWFGLVGNFEICKKLTREPSFQSFHDPKDRLGIGMIVQPENGNV